jgi:hypothetical protein
MTSLSRWFTTRLAGRSKPAPPETSGTEQHSIQPTEETDMPTATTDDRIVELRSQLDEIASESAADPASVAENLGAWRSRESTRQDRIVAIEQRIRDLGTLGDLLDDQPAMAAIREYLKQTGDARSKLEYVAENRVFRRDKSSPDTRAYLKAWWRELHQLNTVLPAHDDGDRYVTEQVTAWFRARDGALMALILQGGGVDVAAPELPDNVDRLAGLPRGLAYGVHKAAIDA